MDSFDYNTFIGRIWFERRDIVSGGYDRSLNYIKGIFPEMEIHSYPSGTNVWTWVIPEKWSVKSAYIKAGNKILLDLDDHPLHVMSYSTPFSGSISQEELMSHLHTRCEYPDAIPFEFSYYQPKWGFCIQHDKLKDFTFKKYDVLIDSTFERGELKVGCYYIKGRIDKEIVIIAHLCHPCMVDDGLSGVAVLLKIADFCKNNDNYYSYRFLILPETIGSIAYLSHNEHIIEKLQYGIFLEMLGHDDLFSLQRSIQGNTLIDRAAFLSLKQNTTEFRAGGFYDVVGNDERVFNGIGVNVPTISISRSNFWSNGHYPEYHTSADTPDIITAGRLIEAQAIVINLLKMLNLNYYPKAIVKGPIFLTRYGLWVDWRIDASLNAKQEMIFNYLHYGKKSIIDIAYELDLSFDQVKNWLDKFYENNLIEKLSSAHAIKREDD
ncbi:MAG: DUF4910 domain-containing protein [Nitrospirae bacterium]|nr:DUF4910 domain-containing protein [Nitrospirota bacterium]